LQNREAGTQQKNKAQHRGNGITEEYRNNRGVGHRNEEEAEQWSKVFSSGEGAEL
jgi:hypothetical protein